MTKRGYHHGNLRQALVDAALELIEVLAKRFPRETARAALTARRFPRPRQTHSGATTRLPRPPGMVCLARRYRPKPRHPRFGRLLICE